MKGIQRMVVCVEASTSARVGEVLPLGNSECWAEGFGYENCPRLRGYVAQPTTFSAVPVARTTILPVEDPKP